MVSLDFGSPDIAVPDSAVRHRVARNRIDFMWADKVGLVLLAVGVAVIGCLWVIAAIAAGTAGANHLARCEIALGLETDFVVAAVFWAALVTIDFALGGPKRRARQYR